CQEGSRNFSQNLDLLVYKQHHTDEKHCRCLECGRSFRQRSHLICHQKIHTGEQP
ncbi:ZNF80 protein, partial [Prunella fulvescens]|nr:ZNF80 protein [Prunella fulvescens]